MAKKQKTGKQPYIPLYIGDWEQDTNMLSLEAEAGWLKIIFKMFKNGKTGIYKTSTKALQNLWRKTPSEIAMILNELKVENVCFVEKIGDEITFRNRRMEREFALSKVRSKAVENRYKKDTKEVHPPEYENDIDTEIDTKVVVRNRGMGKGFYTDELDKTVELTEIQIGATIQFLSFTCNTNWNDEMIKKRWEAFKINQFQLHEYYDNFEKLLVHFRNTLKKELQNGSAAHQSTAKNGNKAGVGDTRTNAYKNWGFK